MDICPLTRFRLIRRNHTSSGPCPDHDKVPVLLLRGRSRPTLFFQPRSRTPMRLRFFFIRCVFFIVSFVARHVAMDCVLYSHILITHSFTDTGVCFFSSYSRMTTLPPLKQATPSPTNPAYVVLRLARPVCLSHQLLSSK